MCSIERRTNLWSGQWPQDYIQVSNQLVECSYRQGNGPMLFVHIIWPHWKETISHFCDTLEMWILSNFGRNQRIQRNQRTQRNQLSVLWNFSYPNPETSLTLGIPKAYPIAQYTAYPSGGYPMAQGLKEIAIQPREATLQPRDFRRPPYGPGTSWGCHTAQRGYPMTRGTAPQSTAYPLYPSFRQSIPKVPSIPSKHSTEYKTTRLQI